MPLFKNAEVEKLKEKNLRLVFDLNRAKIRIEELEEELIEWSAYHLSNCTCEWCACRLDKEAAE